MRRAGPRFIGTAVAAIALAVGMTTAASAANTWTVQPVPFPTTALRSAEMAAVSCTSATRCEAVMNTDTAEPEAAKWNGTSWKLQVLPRGNGDQFASSISCAAPTTCIAVGDSADWWNGTVWQPMAGGGGAGVSCPSVRYCVAVGSQVVGGIDEPSAEKWNGTIWKPTTVPTTSPTGDGGLLQSVSCTGIINCVAVGETSDTGAGPVIPIAYHWNGTTWTQQTLPPPPAGTATPELKGVSCSSATNCMAVGDDENGGDGGNTLFADHWNGTTWTQQSPLPLPVGTITSELTGISCVSTRCTAVGWSFPAAGTSYKNRHALAEYFNGTTWAIQPTAQPNAHQYLSAVSCVAIRTCTAVGASITKSPNVNNLPLAEQD